MQINKSFFVKIPAQAKLTNARVMYEAATTNSKCSYI